MLAMGRFRGVGRLRWSIVAIGSVAAFGLAMALRPASSTPAATLPAPDFTLPLAAGGSGQLSLRQLRGHPVLLSFFEATCAPCIEEVPVLRDAARRFRGQKVIVLGVATGGDTAFTAQAFARTHHLDYPVVADEHQEVAWRYNVEGWPTSFFIDAQGNLRGETSGGLTLDTVRGGLAQAGALHCDNCTAVAPPTLLSEATSNTAADALSADTILPARAAPRFSLRDQNGVFISPDTLRGKVVAFTVISALCREQCPLIGQALAQVHRQLGPAGKRLAIVAISANPEFDTPAATQAFARESGWQGTEWHYLTAPRSVLSGIWKAYGIYVAPPAPIFKAATLDHQPYVYLIDPRGRLRALYDVPFLAPRVAASVRALLNGA